MPRKSIHWRAVRDYPSFPNNRRSTRFPRRKAVTKRIWKEEESPAYFGVPNTALSTPWDVPNPTDRMPGLKNYHSIHYSDAGGYAPAPIPGLGMGLGLPDPAENGLQCHPLLEWLVVSIPY